MKATEGHKKALKKYYNKHKEELISYASDKYRKSREAILRNQKKYNDTHKDTRSAYAVEYRKKNRYKMYIRYYQGIQYLINRHNSPSRAQHTNSTDRMDWVIKMSGCSSENDLINKISEILPDGYSIDDIGSTIVLYFRKPLRHFDLENQDEAKAALDLSNVIYGTKTQRKAHKLEYLKSTGGK